MYELSSPEAAAAKEHCLWALCRVKRGNQGFGEMFLTMAKAKIGQNGLIFERKDLFLDLAGQGCVLKISI